MEEDRGSLIEIVEPEDPRMMIKRMYPWIIMMADFALMVFFVVYMSFLPEFYYFVIVVIVVASLGVGGIFHFFIFRHISSRTTEPIKIYPNGVEAFPSPFYRLRGLDGFISKDRMDRIEVRILAYRTQGSSMRPEWSGSIGNDWLIVLHTRDRRSRGLGIRSSMTAEKAVKTMRKAWGIPIVGIGEMDAIEQTEKRR